MKAPISLQLKETAPLHSHKRPIKTNCAAKFRPPSVLTEQIQLGRGTLFAHLVLLWSRLGLVLVNILRSQSFTQLLTYLTWTYFKKKKLLKGYFVCFPWIKANVNLTKLKWKPKIQTKTNKRTTKKLRTKRNINKTKWKPKLKEI